MAPLVVAAHRCRSPTTAASDGIFAFELQVPGPQLWIDFPSKSSAGELDLAALGFRHWLRQTGRNQTPACEGLAACRLPQLFELRSASLARLALTLHAISRFRIVELVEV